VVAVEALVVLGPFVFTEIPLVLELFLTPLTVMQAVHLATMFSQESRTAGIVVAKGTYPVAGRGGDVLLVGAPRLEVAIASPALLVVGREFAVLAERVGGKKVPVAGMARIYVHDGGQMRR
jgi:hypothetical protein